MCVCVHVHVHRTASYVCIVCGSVHRTTFTCVYHVWLCAQDCFPARLCAIYVVHEPRWLLLLVQLLRPLLSQVRSESTV